VTERPDISLRIHPTDGDEYLLALPNARKRHVIGRKGRGKSRGIHVQIPDKHISLCHCEIRWDNGDGWIVNDLNSTNGAIFNGEPLLNPQPVKDKDEILIGTTRIIVEYQAITEKNRREAIVDSEEMTIPGGAAATEILPEATEGEESTIGAKTTVMAESSGGEGTTEVAPEVDKTTGDGRQDREQRRPVTGLTGIAIDLVKANLLGEAMAKALTQTARDSGRTFFKTLADDDSVRFKDDIFDFVAKKLGIQLIRDERSLGDEVISVDWLPIAAAETMGVQVLEPRRKNTVRYATIDPFDIMQDDWVARCARSSVEKVLASPGSFFTTINRLKNLVSEEEAGKIGIAIDITMDRERQIRSRIESIDVPQIVNFFLHRGFMQGASDIHIEPTEDSVLVRNRVDGILHEDTTLPQQLHPGIISRVKIISGMDVAEKRRPQDGRIGAVIRGTPIDVRVSSYPTVHGEKVVMRLLDKSALRPSPEALGLLARDLRVLKDKINAPYGLMMISGPTGSGKTTTLYSCLGSIDKDAKNVLTIEDPVEYRVRGVHQMQVNEKINLTFASGLRTILRQDPDVIMIGECRDVDTSSMAIQASLTGHIVFSTIHTNDAVGVITRLLDMNIDAFLVANALSLAVAQRLVRCICQHCKNSVSGEKLLRKLEEEGISNERLAVLGIEIDPQMYYVQGAGCVHCHNTGYLGRQAVFELFEMTSEARAMIMSANFNADSLRAHAIRNGMTTLIRHGLHLVEEGITTHEEVIRVLGETH